jgi:GMP synthase-like glutamine amidotransferase
LADLSRREGTVTQSVLILDGSNFSPYYDPVAHWRRLLGSVPYRAVHLPSADTPPDLAGATHVIVTGSEASIVSETPWFFLAAGVLRRAVAAGLPVFGSCFGHQMLAWALSGPGSVAPSPTPELGWISIERLEPDPLLAGLPNPCHVFASHFDEVREPPPPWRVLARSETCAVQVMRFGLAPVWGIQPHPEMTVADARLLLQGILRAAPEREALVKSALTQEPRDDDIAGRLVENFLAVGD